MIHRLLLPAVLLLAAAPAPAAGPMTVYQCTEPDGSITLQTEEPCPQGVPQQVRVVNVPPPVTLRPAHVEPRMLQPSRLPVLRAGPMPEDPGALTDAPEPGPPPPLFQCVRWDGTRYLYESEDPEPQCRALQTVGIGGLAGMGAGQACERVYDECTPVPEQALCQAWETQLRETEFHWKFAQTQREVEARRAEYERLAAVHADSTCAPPDPGT